jgi:hypothetical protein
VKKNVASQSIGAEMITAADGTAFTGSVSVLVTIDNGTQTAGGGTAPAHEGNGYHSYTPTQAETNGDHIAFTFTGTGAIPATIQVYTNFPQTADHTAAIADIPTNAEFNARTLASADYFDFTTDLVTLAAVTHTGATIPNVTLVATTTTNTDMVGTDNALLSASYTAPDNAGITANGVAIAALNNITAADVWSVATRELTSGSNIVLSKGVGLLGLNDIAATDVLSAGDIDGYTLEESQKLNLAASTGVLSGAATTTVTIQAADGSKARLTATVDADGNRSAVIKDATG